MSMTMELKGGKELQAALDALPEKIAKKGTVEALMAGGELILAAAKARAPRKTGALSENLHMTVVRKKTGPVVLIGTGIGNVDVQKALRSVYKGTYALARRAGSQKEYARFSARVARKIQERKLAEHGISKRMWQGQYYGSMLEFGTKKMQPRPWLRPAVEEIETKVADAVAEPLKRFIETQATKKE